MARSACILAVCAVACCGNLLEAQTEPDAVRVKKYQQPADRKAEDRELIAMNYSVADLVIPVPRMVRVSTAGSGAKAAPMPREAPEFDALIDLITSTIEPATWDDVGGPGTIRKFETTFSLVIRQTRAVHGKISAMLDRFRRLQDVQVSLDIKVVSLPNGFARLKFLGIDWTSDVALLSEEQLSSLLRELESDDSHRLFTAPKITTFNGQSVMLQRTENPDPGRLLMVHARAAADRRSVHLKLAVDCRQPEDVLDRVITANPEEGETVLLNVFAPSPLGRTIAASAAKIEAATGSATQGKQHTRTVILVTPRIIVAEEEKVAAFPLKHK